MNFNVCEFKPLTEEAANEISLWEYDAPYDMYSFKGRKNGYLMNKATWGVEQFALFCGGTVVGQAACQFDGGDLWVGWSLSPELCGKGGGHAFVLKCLEEIRKVKSYDGKIYLRVAASNKRAVGAYQKAGFVYSETVADEIPYSDKTEDFWVMVCPEQVV